MRLYTNFYYVILVVISIVFLKETIKSSRIVKGMFLEFTFVFISLIFETLFSFDNSNTWTDVAQIYQYVFPSVLIIAVFMSLLFENIIGTKQFYSAIVVYAFLSGCSFRYIFVDISIVINYAICISLILVVFILKLKRGKTKSIFQVFQLPLMAISVYFSVFIFVIGKHYSRFSNSFLLKPLAFLFISILIFNLLFIYEKSRRYISH